MIGVCAPSHRSGSSIHPRWKRFLIAITAPCVASPNAVASSSHACVAIAAGSTRVAITGEEPTPRIIPSIKVPALAWRPDSKFDLVYIIQSRQRISSTHHVWGECICDDTETLTGEQSTRMTSHWRALTPRAESGRNERQNQPSKRHRWLPIGLADGPQTRRFSAAHPAMSHQLLPISI